MHKQDADRKATTDTRTQLTARFAMSYDGRGYVASAKNCANNGLLSLCRVLYFSNDGAEAYTEVLDNEDGGYVVHPTEILEPLHEIDASLIRRSNTHDWPMKGGGMRGLRALINVHGPVMVQVRERIGNLLESRPFVMNGISVQPQWADYESVLQVRLTNAVGRWCVLDYAMYDGKRGNKHVFVRTHEQVCHSMLAMMSLALKSQSNWQLRNGVPALALGNTEQGGSMARK